VIQTGTESAQNSNAFYRGCFESPFWKEWENDKLKQRIFPFVPFTGLCAMWVLTYVHFICLSKT